MLWGSLPDGKRIMQDKISKSKHQIPNKFQIFTLWNPAFGRFARGEIPQGRYSMTKTQNRFGISNFAHCDFFGICNLLFVIFTHSNMPIPRTKMGLVIFTGTTTEIAPGQSFL